MGVIDTVRTGLARGARWFEARVSKESRNPESNRVFYSGRTLAGPSITPDTALTVSACWAAHRFLTQTVGVLPWRVMKDGPSGPEIATTHPLDYLLNDRPSAEWSSMQLRETVTGWAVRHGNGYAEIERDTRSRPLALWPIHPERVTPCRDPETRELYYRVTNYEGGIVIIDAADMLHIRGFGEGPIGLSVIAYAAESIGAAKAAQLFGAGYFGNSATPAFVVTSKKPMTPAGIAALEKKIHERFGGPRRQNKTAVLDAEIDIKAISNDADKAQLVESQQHYVEEICRWFGVPPHKVQHLARATYSNIEHQAIEVVTDAILPWAKRWEQEANYKLFGVQNRRGFYTHMDFRYLLRGDAAARAAYYNVMRTAGVYSVNDIRRDEQMPTIGPDGDKRIVQSGFITLEQLGEMPTATAPGAPAPNADDGDGEAPPAPLSAAERNARDRVLARLGLARPLLLEATAAEVIEP